MGRKKKLKALRKIASKMPEVKGVNHNRRLKKAMYNHGFVGVAAYVRAVESFVKGETLSDIKQEENEIPDSSAV